jgi:hypothetical protein
MQELHAFYDLQEMRRVEIIHQATNWQGSPPSLDHEGIHGVS